MFLLCVFETIGIKQDKTSFLLKGYKLYCKIVALHRTYISLREHQFIMRMIIFKLKPDFTFIFCPNLRCFVYFEPFKGFITCACFQVLLSFRCFLENSFILMPNKKAELLLFFFALSMHTIHKT